MPSLRKIYQYTVIHFARFFTKKNVVFYCNSSFHIAHIKGVISRFSLKSKSRVFLVCPVAFDTSHFHNVTCIISTLNDIPKHIIVDLLVSSEIIFLPYYFCGKAIYFGHGIGPKINYQLKSNVEKFDHVFSPCKYFYDEFYKVLPLNKVVSVGLPILDEKVGEPNKKIILYAPSWCNDDHYISDIKGIVKKLGKLDEYRIIVSLHPNLIRDSLVNFDDMRLEGAACEYLHETEFKDSFETLKEASIIVGDISSTIFEALAFNIPIVFDGNTSIYEYCRSTSVLSRVQDCFYEMNDISNNSKVDILIGEDNKKQQRQCFASEYLLNQGRATDIFVQELETVLSKLNAPFNFFRATLRLISKR